jgi:hypothetical protein
MARSVLEVDTTNSINSINLPISYGDLTAIRFSAAMLSGTLLPTLQAVAGVADPAALETLETARNVSAVSGLLAGSTDEQHQQNSRIYGGVPCYVLVSEVVVVGGYSSHFRVKFCKKVKFSPLQAVEAHRVVRG